MIDQARGLDEDELLTLYQILGSVVTSSRTSDSLHRSEQQPREWTRSRPMGVPLIDIDKALHWLDGVDEAKVILNNG